MSGWSGTGSMFARGIFQRIACEVWMSLIARNKEMAAVVVSIVLWSLSALGQGRSSAGELRVMAVPMHSATPQQRFPRVSGLPDAAVQERINAVLAAREKEDAGLRRNCLRDGHIARNDPDGYSEKIRVTYLSPRFLSIEVRESDSGCGAYPNANVPTPITLDLRTGQELDWKGFFTDGFLSPSGDRPSRLTQLYLRRAGTAAPDPTCRPVIEEATYILWLDQTKRALIAEPDIPHVVRACAQTVAIPFSDIAPFVVDKSTMRDLSSAQ